ncbi:MAG: hypothetical protein KPEEDBHJ_01000 [Anaerolineales bacterium]|nr:hypothetical protein [Anaerolineales bacterium]
MEKKMPNLFDLYRRDLTINYAVKAVVVALVFLGGTYYADPAMLPVVLFVALPVALIGLIVLAVRYNSVMSTLRDGITVKGVVDGFDHQERRQKDDYGRVKSRSYSYYVNVSYTVNGETHKKRIRMPGSGFMFNIHDKQEVELLYKESSPHKVLLKNVYFSRF